MKGLLKSAGVAVVSCGLIAGCGLNPFGGSMGSMSIFAKVGKAVQKPSAINDPQNDKQTASAKVGAAMAKSMASGMAKSAVAEPTWILGRGITSNGDGWFTYWESVVNRPSDDDPRDKTSTGLGEVVFKSNVASPTLDVPGTVTDVKSFHFIGHETKKWNLEVDSLDIRVTFNQTIVGDLKPGLSTVWGKNISETIAQGAGDTAFFSVDTLVGDIQKGAGHFFDAHTGTDNSGESFSFNFGLTIDHKGTFGNYNDNTGTVNFTLPWSGGEADSLYFDINFLTDYERNGKIYENDAHGVLRAEFTHNEKNGHGTTKYYNKKGDLIDQDTY